MSTIDLTLARALLFTPDCTIAMEGDFGQGGDPFSVGGDIYIGPDPDEGGSHAADAPRRGVAATTSPSVMTLESGCPNRLPS